MKRIYYISLFALIGCFYACEDVQLGPKDPGVPWEMGPITEYSVNPINGGAEISYSIPDNPDIMYVMAEYERNGKIFTEKSSVHTNMLTIEGYHRVDRAKATLYMVNRFEQRSKPLVVEFEPLESIIDLAFESLTLKTGFGGIVASWVNPTAIELGVRLMTYDDSLYHDLVTREMYYTQIEEEIHSFRGFESVETTFAVAFEDKWGNISDTLQYVTTPFFETEIPKPYVDYRANVPWDNTTDLSSSYPFTKIWDNIVNTSRNGWLTKAGSSGLSITIDMKQRVKLSRILHHAYHINSPYGQVNITSMEIWGTDKIDYDKLSDRYYWLDSLSLANGHIKELNPTTPLPERTFKDDWQYLGYHSVPYYTASADIQVLSQSGAEYEMPIDAEPVRYIRIFVRAIALSMRSDNYFSMGEITFFGDNTVPQE
jgi:hypothetical protein